MTLPLWKRRWLWISLASLFLFAFFGLTHFVLEAAPIFIDPFATQTVTDFRQPLLTDFFRNFTHLGSRWALTAFTIVGIAILCWKNDRRGALYLTLNGLGTIALALSIKPYVARNRPDLPDRLVQAGGYSFPSGHALGSTAICFALALAFGHGDRRRLWPSLALASLFVGLIALSRIYLGVHYATDVIGGSLLGLGWAMLLATFVLPEPPTSAGP